jgi:hypothetical protein
VPDARRVERGSLSVSGSPASGLSGARAIRRS